MNASIQNCMRVWMYVCMHVCMHDCVHACMYVCVHACMYVCMRVCWPSASRAPRPRPPTTPRFPAAAGAPAPAPAEEKGGEPPITHIYILKGRDRSFQNRSLQTWKLAARGRPSRCQSALQNPQGAHRAPPGAPLGLWVLRVLLRFRLALAGRALRVSIRKFPLENDMTGFEMIGRVPLQ